MFYEIIRSALFEIVFFAIMHLIIMYGFAVMGHMLFGTNDHSFHSLNEAFITVFLMLIGSCCQMELNKIPGLVAGLPCWLKNISAKKNARSHLPGRPGSKSSFDIICTSESIRAAFGKFLQFPRFELIFHILGVSFFLLINQLLLNMLVAIYASHYFTYCLEQGDEKTNMFKLVMSLLGGEPPTPEEAEKAENSKYRIL
jgi:hypothetical protein